MKTLGNLRLERIPSPLLNNLDAREAAIWVLEPFAVAAGPFAAAKLMRLPWRLVLTEASNPELLSALEEAEMPAAMLVRLRGFVHLVDTNPTDITLPPRCLPVYLLNGRDKKEGPLGITAMTRRLSMLDTLRRSNVKHLVIAAGPGAVIPPELVALWQDGLRTIVYVASDAAEAESQLETWRNARASDLPVAYFPFSAGNFCSQLVDAYFESQASDRVLLRIRNVRGEAESLDITGLDDPERPVLGNYEILTNAHLRRLQPNDLSSDQAYGYFVDTSASWRPYAAGLPWSRDDSPWQILRARLRRLDMDGPEAGRILYIQAESGAGGTTLMRSLAWSAAEQGYPTLVARSAPFTPQALELVNLMTRVVDARRGPSSGGDERLYEAPWLLVFDRTHWQGRADELRHFLKEFERSGRPVCVLIVTGPYLDPDFDSRFSRLAFLSHQVQTEEAAALGRHLNRYLAPHGPTRTEAEWRSFYEATAVHAERGIAAFWIALSFWVQRQFDMNETVQAWIYRQFKESVQDRTMYQAILDIAAMSTERRPLPESMLPISSGGWPVSQRLEDMRREVPALGLARISRDGDRYWAMAHDVIGRYLISALFDDPVKRIDAGFESASAPEHLRFLILRRLSCQPALGYTVNRAIGEEFAVSIFKIDPGGGHANFALYWKEVLEALDEMPKELRSTSRSFLHHTAISRRRIAKDIDFFPIGPSERITLLERAISDIRYALESIPADPDSESDLNLYNSLAHAYQDLADEEARSGSPQERIKSLRAKAHEATLRAYRASPDNSFVIETYARSLISEARLAPERAVENSVEVLNLVYGAMERDKTGQRRLNLGKLANAALDLLLENIADDADFNEPRNESEALAVAIYALVHRSRRSEGMKLDQFPKANRLRAAELLASPMLRGNPQALRLRYALLCIDAPYDFRGQLELLQSLESGGSVISPQMLLDLALLLQQSERHHEADRLFRRLRRLWSEGDHYVEVPDRLRWLMSLDGKSQRQVTATVMPGGAYRRMAKVRELQNTPVLFRSQEFGQRELRPGTVIRGFISFGHNGPFLRPTTAVPA